MKMVKKMGLVLLLLLVATAGFSFDWISLTKANTPMQASFSAGYGNLIFIPVDVWPVGGAFELAIPGVERLYAGVGMGYLGLEFDYEGTANDVFYSYFRGSTYAKYIILNQDEMNEIAGFPLYVGAAGGLGFQLGFDDYAGTDGDDYSGLSGLAVVMAGYEFEGSSITAYGGWIDRDWGYSGEWHFRLSEDLHLGLFWVPILGLGATVTLAF